MFEVKVEKKRDFNGYLYFFLVNQNTIELPNEGYWPRSTLLLVNFNLRKKTPAKILKGANRVMDQNGPTDQPTV